eukprot:8509202-Alexandrium_andersonii.AAC.1
MRWYCTACACQVVDAVLRVCATCTLRHALVPWGACCIRLLRTCADAPWRTTRQLRPLPRRTVVA